MISLFVCVKCFHTTYLVVLWRKDVFEYLPFELLCYHFYFRLEVNYFCRSNHATKNWESSKLLLLLEEKQLNSIYLCSCRKLACSTLSNNLQYNASLGSQLPRAKRAAPPFRVGSFCGWLLVLEQAPHLEFQLSAQLFGFQVGAGSFDVSAISFLQKTRRLGEPTLKRAAPLPVSGSKKSEAFKD